MPPSKYAVELSHGEATLAGEIATMIKLISPERRALVMLTAAHLVEHSSAERESKPTRRLGRRTQAP